MKIGLLLIVFGTFFNTIASFASVDIDPSQDVGLRHLTCYDESTGNVLWERDYWVIDITLGDPLNVRRVVGIENGQCILGRPVALKCTRWMLAPYQEITPPYRELTPPCTVVPSQQLVYKGGVDTYSDGGVEM